MVGYHKHDSLTQQQKFIAGCVSGSVTRFLTQPLDVLKVNIQVHRHSRHLFRRIVREGGLSALWHGHNLGQMHSIVSIGTQFFLYEIFTEFWKKQAYYTKSHNLEARFVCACLAGCASATLALPLEVMRVRQMIGKEQYGGTWKSARAVYKAGGISAFYEGLSASLLQSGLQVGIAFTVFSYTQEFIMTKTGHRNATNVLLASAAAGCIAGLMSKTITYPLDLVKRRLQIAVNTYYFCSLMQVPISGNKYLILNSVIEIGCPLLYPTVRYIYREVPYFINYRAIRVLKEKRPKRADAVWCVVSHFGAASKTPSDGKASVGYIVVGYLRCTKPKSPV